MLLKQINKNNNKKTMRDRERKRETVKDDGDERESNLTRENT
jgi:hypothetical protein